MNLVIADQEKNINTVVEYYKIKKIEIRRIKVNIIVEIKNFLDLKT